jgi:hypothetical protein
MQARLTHGSAKPLPGVVEEVLGRGPKMNDNDSGQFFVTGQPTAVRLFQGCSKSEIARQDIGR